MMLTKFANTPWKITIIAMVVSPLFAGVFSYAITQEVTSVALIISVLCAGPIAYGTSSIAFRYQKELEKKNVQLEQLTRELQVSNAELDAFAHTVAHDLKNPLTTLIGASSMLQEMKLPIEQQQQMIDIVFRTGQKMDNIVHELLLLSTLRESDTIQIEPLNMNQILSEAEERLGALQKQKNASITHPNSWPIAKGYAPWVEAIWTNYLSNAIKYGGQPPEIVLGATHLDDMTVKFWVQDNGAGISTEQQQQLFTPFERLTQTSIEGHGLGLSIVQRIVHRLEGQVGVESNGHGSTFYFTLPLAN